MAKVVPFTPADGISAEERRRQDELMDRQARLAALIHEVLIQEALKVPTPAGRHLIVGKKVGDYVIGSVSSRVDGIEANDITLMVRSVGGLEEKLFQFSFREHYTSQPGQGAGVEHVSVEVELCAAGVWIDHLIAALEAEAAEIAASAKRN